MTLKDVLIIGGAQVLALIPGTSRSGITITAALMVGMSREGAARFSFLLSIPVIVLAGGLEAINLLKDPRAYRYTGHVSRYFTLGHKRLCVYPLLPGCD